jgi:hypothetical protein
MSSDLSSPGATEPTLPPGVPEELPPVTPPSAGFIIQLFLIPAFIVAAIIGVWGLFGQLAGSEVDLDRLVAELGNNNEHRRWRAAHNLYVLLQNERNADPDDTNRLCARKDIAEGLTTLLNNSLDSLANNDSKVLNHQVFLARTMGSLEAEDIVLPALAKAMNSNQDVDVRKSAIMSLTLIAARHFAERTGTTSLPGRTNTPDLSPLKTDIPLPLQVPSIDDKAALEELMSAAQDSDASIRHLAAYTLGLISGPDAIEQLRVLLLDSDESTQVNAAIALSRNADVGGMPTIIEVLRNGLEPLETEEFKALPEAEKQNALTAQLYDQATALVNCLTAVSKLWDRIEDSNKAKLLSVIEKLESDHASPGIRLHAKAVLRVIQPSE